MAEVCSWTWVVLTLCLCNFLVVNCYFVHDEDEVVHHAMLGSDREVRRRKIDQPIRITTIYRNLSGLQDHQIVKVKHFLKEAVEYMRRALRVRKTVTVIRLQRRCKNNSYFVNNRTGEDLRYCQVACDSSPPCGFVVPAPRDLEQCRVCDEHGNDCKDATGLENVAGQGYNDTDFVLFVTSSDRNCERKDTVAYAAVCQQEEILDRPIAGYLNVCPNNISSRKADGAELLASLKHEIFHALGFSPSLYAFYRDANGEPLTPRSSTGMPKSFDDDLKVYQWSNKVIKEVIRPDWMIRSDKGRDGTVQHKINLIVTKNVKEEARKHFNCLSLEGGELENQGSKGTVLAHWEKRVFENEGMTGATTKNAVFSRITLALMEDTGWYKVDYSMAEPLRWGKNRGCVFAKNSCKAWMSLQKNAKQTIAPFCDVVMSPLKGKQTKCTVDHQSVALCNLHQYKKTLPLEYQYFENLPGIADPQFYGGSVAIADYCPFYQALTWTRLGQHMRGSTCRFSENSLEQEKNYALESYGNTSTCIAHGQNWSKTKCRVKWTARDWGSGCYNHICDSEGLSIVIEGYKYRCFHKGQVLDVRMQTTNGWDYEGTLICPACDEVCFASGGVCPAEIKPPPTHSQPSPVISEVTCAAVGKAGVCSVLCVCVLLGLTLL